MIIYQAGIFIIVVQRKMLLEMTVELERIKSDHEGKGCH